MLEEFGGIWRKLEKFRGMWRRAFQYPMLLEKSIVTLHRQSETTTEMTSDLWLSPRITIASEKIEKVFSSFLSAQALFDLLIHRTRREGPDEKKEAPPILPPRGGALIASNGGGALTNQSYTRMHMRTSLINTHIINN